MNAPATEMRDIAGYEGLYAITRDGRVWAYPKAWVTGVDGNIKCAHRGVWLKLLPSKRGYVSVNLHRTGERRSCHVHRLVAQAWIPNPESLPQVNHKNTLKWDNVHTNLEWCTGAHNKQHAVAMGLCPVTGAFLESVRKNVKKAHAATRKLTHAQAQDARRRFAGGERKAHIAKSLGIAFATLCTLLRGETYAE